jgi:hypothetical protein
MVSAFKHACLTSISVASGFADLTFSMIDPVNITGLCGTTAIWDLNDLIDTFLRSCPSISICPSEDYTSGALRETVKNKIEFTYKIKVFRY